MFEVQVSITLKKTVVDPQGTTVKHALESLGYKGLGDVRMGKLVTFRFEARDKEQAESQVDEMCRKLLANPIIEEYTYTLREA